MTELKNDRLLRALRREPVDVTPVWIMRQAGRYLPEYRAVRERAGDFLTLCSTPELACEVTLQPINRFALDAAIIFSDILTIPDAMGLGLYFVDGEGPAFRRSIRSEADVAALGVPDPEHDLRYVMDAIRMARRELDGRVPLIGFSGSPWTLATYMVQGGSSRDFAEIKRMLYRAPETLHRLLAVLARAVTEYLTAQVAAGAQALMIFDTWGGVLSTHDYRAFSLNYMSDILSVLKRHTAEARVPVILFTKNGGQWLEAMADSGADALGIDWTTDIHNARERVGNRVALQGNLDPAALGGTPETIGREVTHILERFGHGQGHVFNLGHGITPDIDPENVAFLVNAVHELSRSYHR
ncbi:MAG: uroporphyrinogen decarboxylase [Candidatus Muproteobacteria bacterium RBG_16_60_9]|uniref:Uroporphyrinogen decarboxylase n=1 Tax=Candidatus Muproteobacteria bacterium RBG_16_60_9 TaxID=1817755 RepID=A0A1F6VL94_9PROT|nr:MAG: uroporphyrinogen decarboxylase [Candidatus Muproteobacteria bacterium RBG_16_60_9]